MALFRINLVDNDNINWFYDITDTIYAYQRIPVSRSFDTRFCKLIALVKFYEIAYKDNGALCSKTQFVLSHITPLFKSGGSSNFNLNFNIFDCRNINLLRTQIANAGEVEILDYLPCLENCAKRRAFGSYE